MFDIIVLLSVGYEYYRREKRHRLMIESLKGGILPEVDIQQETIFGLSITLLFTILYIGFMAFLAYFFFFSLRLRGALWFSTLFLIPWFGIGVTLVLITIRNVKTRRKKNASAKEAIV
jgi:hypothetical protein